MTKSEMIQEVAARREITQADASLLVDLLFDPEVGIIAQAIKAGDEVRIHGFGVFGAMERAARDGFNPKTGKKIKIGATRTIKFRVGSNLRKFVNS